MSKDEIIMLNYIDFILFENEYEIITSFNVGLCSEFLINNCIHNDYFEELSYRKIKSYRKYSDKIADSVVRNLRKALNER